MEKETEWVAETTIYPKHKAGGGVEGRRAVCCHTASGYSASDTSAAPRRHSISHNPVLPSQLCPRPSSVFNHRIKMRRRATGGVRVYCSADCLGVSVRLTHLQSKIESSDSERGGTELRWLEAATPKRERFSQPGANHPIMT